MVSEKLRENRLKLIADMVKCLEENDLLAK